MEEIARKRLSALFVHGTSLGRMRYGTIDVIGAWPVYLRDSFGGAVFSPRPVRTGSDHSYDLPIGAVMRTITTPKIPSD